MLKRLFKTRPAVQAGRALDEAARSQARAPGFYLAGGVPDTPQGRFELYLLHVVLALHRLRHPGEAASGQASETGQALFDAFLHNLDEGLRDMGVGDLSVGKKMRKLGEAIYGRAKAYDAVLADPDPQALTGLLGRTLYGDADPAHAPAMARYVTVVAHHLTAIPLDRVLAGEITFPEFSA